MSSWHRFPDARLGVATPETLRQWIREGAVDSGQRPGVTSGESTEIRRLKRERQAAPRRRDP